MLYNPEIAIIKSFSAYASETRSQWIDSENQFHTMVEYIVSTLGNKASLADLALIVMKVYYESNSQRMYDVLIDTHMVKSTTQNKVTRALNQLVKSGKLEKTGKFYACK
jgi:hypothetical protein